MVECPKCNESGLTWQKTSKGKNWLKRDLGEGQVSKDWHTCSIITGEDKPLHSFCHECHTKIIHCDMDDCEICNIEVSFCARCYAHVSVVDRK